MAGGSFSALTPPAAGNVITRQWGLDVRDSVITSHASAAVRDAAITAPVEGQVAYLQDDDVFTFYTGTAWKAFAGPPTVYKPDDETINNSSVMQNDDDLVIPVIANAVYKGELFLSFNANAAAGLKVIFTGPAGATLEASHFLTVVTGTTITNMTSAMGSVTGISGTGTNMPFHMWFTLFTGGSAGNLQFQWAQNAAHASNCTVLKGSSLQLQRCG